MDLTDKLKQKTNEKLANGKFTRLFRGRRRRALRLNFAGFSTLNRLIVVKLVFLEKLLYSPKLENIFWRANSQNEKLDKTRAPNKSLRLDTSEHRFYSQRENFRPSMDFSHLLILIIYD